VSVSLNRKDGVIVEMGGGGEIDYEMSKKVHREPNFGQLVALMMF
jgi:hypothetical protein